MSNFVIYDMVFFSGTYFGSGILGHCFKRVYCGRLNDANNVYIFFPVFGCESSKIFACVTGCIA